MTCPSKTYLIIFWVIVKFLLIEFCSYTESSKKVESVHHIGKVIGKKLESAVILLAIDIPYIIHIEATKVGRNLGSCTGLKNVPKSNKSKTPRKGKPQ